MGVYVKDATAPKNCTGCIAVHYYMSMVGDAEMLCEVTGLRMDDYYSGGRPDWCPLIEVPEPHGRLISASELIEFIENRYEITWKDDYEGGVKDACVDILEKISTMPTVIPASGEE